MPFLEIRATFDPPPGLLAKVARTVALAFGVAQERVEIHWSTVGSMATTAGSSALAREQPWAAPVVTLSCASQHSAAAVRQAVCDLKDLLEGHLACRRDAYIAVRRV